MARALVISTLKDYLRLFRFPNLLIVALTQYLLAGLVLHPAYARAGISPTLGSWQFFLLVLTTGIIAAAGYLINDILDEPIDRINKPDRQVIGRVLSPSKAWKWYGGLFLAGLLLASYLAVVSKNLPLLGLYPLAFGLLWLYSSRFKKQLLVGNLVVAAFCAMVAGIVWVAERPAFAELQQAAPEPARQVAWVLGSYLLFAFLSTWYREIIKDLEDLKGDRAAGCRTLPIRWGTRAAKVGAAVIAGALLGLLILLQRSILEAGLPGKIVLLLGIAGPILLSLWWLQQAHRPAQFRRLSTLAKLIMLSGLFLLFFL